MSRLDRVREIIKIVDEEDRVQEIIKIVDEEDTHGFCSVGSPWISEPVNEIHCPVDECEECIFNAYPEAGLEDLVSILHE